MSRHGDIYLRFGDDGGTGDEGEYLFRLGIGQLRKLQEQTDFGPWELFKRLSQGRWRVDDVRETIRQGLVGGGKLVTSSGTIDDVRINRLIRNYVDERPWLPNVAIAASILNAAVIGPEDDLIPKSEEAETRPPSSQTASSPSLPTTDGGPPLDSADLSLTT